MKKIPIITLSIAMLGTMFSLPANARYVDEDNATWYTVEELLSYREELDAKRDEACGEDIDCRQEYFFNEIENEPRAMALEQLLLQQFVLTAVNPGAGYVKMLFFGEDMMLSQMGIHEEIGIDQVYMGWMDYEPERIYSGIYFDAYTGGEIDGYHGIYAWESNYGEENLIRADEEVELEANGLIDNASEQLVYAIDSGYGKFNAVGRFIYSDCLMEPDYSEGTECKLMISNEKGQTYYPPRETFSVNESAITDVTGINTEALDENREDLNEELGNWNEEYDDSGEELEVSAGNLNVLNDNLGLLDDDLGETSEKVGEISNANAEFAAKAPNTGTNTAPCGEKIVEFPWWLAGLIIFGDASIMWLFWPNHRKSRKN